MPTPTPRPNGVAIVGEFYDAAVSGADPVGDRPEFVRMLTALLANGASTIIVESPDRGSTQSRLAT
jgi:DNA invertase Pin-like site-specific DNA recombinase